mmetsp:Transcript_6791/g.11329  ORF Transcript_6791/g.11329 Transcript_6791/m.11329 type:complete len:129 (+) Transcript_6791:156-542(+)
MSKLIQTCPPPISPPIPPPPPLGAASAPKARPLPNGPPTPPPPPPCDENTMFRIISSEDYLFWTVSLLRHVLAPPKLRGESPRVFCALLDVLLLHVSNVIATGDEVELCLDHRRMSVAFVVVLGILEN